MDSIPAGLCQCGCGQRTGLASKTNRRAGHIKGRPHRFIARHHHRLRRGKEDHRLSFLIEDRGYVTPCWMWRGSIASNGYGRICRNGKQRQAHLAMYEVLRGKVPAGLHLDHLCRVKACVNPDHLEPVAPAENLRRGLRTKLTKEAVREIRQSPLSNGQLADRFGVAKCTISQVRHGGTWADIR